MNRLYNFYLHFCVVRRLRALEQVKSASSPAPLTGDEFRARLVEIGIL